MAILKNIIRYPVKGLSGNNLEAVQLSPGKPIPCDREYALALADTAFNPEQPEYLRKTHFLMLMRDEQLARLKTEFIEDGHKFIIQQHGSELLNVSLKDEKGAEGLADFFVEFMGEKLKGRPRLVQAAGHMFSDTPEQNLSLINLDSVRDFEEKTGLTVDANRFRGNLLVEGIGAWKEFDLVDQEFSIGGVRFRTAKRIVRCAATNVNLETAERDMNIPLTLRKTYGHSDCGIYIDVIEGDTLKVGDTITLP